MCGRPSFCERRNTPLLTFSLPRNSSFKWNSEKLASLLSQLGTVPRPTMAPFSTTQFPVVVLSDVARPCHPLSVLPSNRSIQPSLWAQHIEATRPHRASFRMRVLYTLLE